MTDYTLQPYWTTPALEAELLQCLVAQAPSLLIPYGSTWQFGHEAAFGFQLQQMMSPGWRGRPHSEVLPLLAATFARPVLVVRVGEGSTWTGARPQIVEWLRETLPQTGIPVNLDETVGNLKYAINWRNRKLSNTPRVRRSVPPRFVDLTTLVYFQTRSRPLGTHVRNLHILEV